MPSHMQKQKSCLNSFFNGIHCNSTIITPSSNLEPDGHAWKSLDLLLLLNADTQSTFLGTYMACIYIQCVHFWAFFGPQIDERQ